MFMGFIDDAEIATAFEGKSPELALEDSMPAQIVKDHARARELFEKWFSEAEVSRAEYEELMRLKDRYETAHKETSIWTRVERIIAEFASINSLEGPFDRDETFESSMQSAFNEVLMNAMQHTTGKVMVKITKWGMEGLVLKVMNHTNDTSAMDRAITEWLEIAATYGKRICADDAVGARGWLDQQLRREHSKTRYSQPISAITGNGATNYIGHRGIRVGVQCSPELTSPIISTSLFCRGDELRIRQIARSRSASGFSSTGENQQYFDRNTLFRNRSLTTDPVFDRSALGRPNNDESTTEFLGDDAFEGLFG